MQIVTRAWWIVGIGSWLAIAGCQGDEECKDWSGTAGRASWGNCGDKRDRKVECEVLNGPALGAPVTCRCSVGGVIGKSFQMENGAGTAQLAVIESATRTANEQCGWKVSR